MKDKYDPFRDVIECYLLSNSVSRYLDRSHDDDLNVLSVTCSKMFVQNIIDPQVFSLRDRRSPLVCKLSIYIPCATTTRCHIRRSCDGRQHQ